MNEYVDWNEYTQYYSTARGEEKFGCWRRVRLKLARLAPLRGGRGLVHTVHGQHEPRLVA